MSLIDHATTKEYIEQAAKTLGPYSAAAKALQHSNKMKDPVFFRDSIRIYVIERQAFKNLEARLKRAGNRGKKKFYQKTHSKMIFQALIKKGSWEKF